MAITVLVQLIQLSQEHAQQDTIVMVDQLHRLSTLLNQDTMLLLLQDLKQLVQIQLIIHFMLNLHD